MKTKFLFAKIICAAAMAVTSTMAVISFSACDNTDDFEFKFIEKSTAYSQAVNNLLAGTYMITAYNGDDTSVTIPSKYKNTEVTVIGQYVFRDLVNLETVEIPDSIVVIESEAFAGCESLDDVIIPDSVAYYGNEIFSKCYSLSSVTLSANCTTISVGMFLHCTSLEEIIIPANVRTIEIMAFTESGLKTVNLPETLMNIKSTAFAGCANLESVVIPDGISQLASSLFEECSSLSSVTIGAGVEEISTSTFGGCGNITKIAVSADNKNYKLIDGNLYTIDGTTLIKYATGNKNTSFTVPENVTTIADNACEGALSLEYVEFDEELTEIGKNAFKGCAALKEATVGANVTKIGESAFSGCSIKKIYYLGTAEQFSAIKIDESNEDFVAAVEYKG